MKRKIKPVVLVFAAALLPLLSVAAGQTVSNCSAEQRLREVELTVTLKHYEKVLAQLFDLRLERALLADSSETDPRTSELDRKIKVLEGQTGWLSSTIREIERAYAAKK